MKNIVFAAIIVASALTPASVLAAAATVGSASYATSFPSTDKAGRNGFPAVTPYVTGDAATRPVPTNDWWSSELALPHAQGIFNYPMALKPVDNGLVIINNMIGQAVTAEHPLTVGVEGVNAPETRVSDYSDWTVTIDWNGMEATVALGTPMVYFTKTAPGAVRVELTSGNVTVDGNKVYVDGSYNRASYVVFAPAGSSWSRTGSVLTSTLGGKDYWTVAMLPAGTDARTGAAALERFAFVFPADTRAEWNYDTATGKVNTVYRVEPDVREGASDRFLMGLLPHHWANVSGTAPDYLAGMEYATARGQLRMAAGNSFGTSLDFSGVLPSLPMPEATDAFSDGELRRLVREVCDDSGFADWTDSYNDGQLLNRMVQTAEAARAIGDTKGFDRAFALVKSQLERWFSYTPGDVAFLFYYHEPWNTMLGYPAGHGQDTNINDHNFHWGYFIRAAALIAQYEPEWAERWGGMVNLLVRDVASSDRNDSMFPYLRSFSPYAGHCWANGTASLGLGNDQESTSEAMEFNTALILWGDITGDTAMRDLGVYLYATELSAIEEYWFDCHDRNHEPGFGYALASRVFGNGYDAENFWGGGIAGSYGIQIYPVHAGSFYLMHRPDYATKLWNAMASETGILSNDDNPNIWYDTWLRFLAMQNPAQALSLYSSCRHLGKKFGESQAHTYQWMHAMNRLGVPSAGISADHPLAMAFDRDGLKTYIARNNGDNTLRVTYSDGYSFEVAPRSMGVSSDGVARPRVSIAVDTQSPKAGETVNISANISLPEGCGVSVERVDFFVDGNRIASALSVPYTAQWTPEAEGRYLLKAVMLASDGSSYSSEEVVVNVTKVGTTSSGSCTTVGTEASEGSFSGQYTVKCTTEGGEVLVRASFEGDYVGFAGPWLFDETDGFREIAMSDDGGGVYTTAIGGMNDGQTLRFRVKIAFAGGLAVTRIIEYVVGSDCGDQSSVAVGSDMGVEVVVWPNPADAVWHVRSECQSAEATVWDTAGRMVGRYALSGGETAIDADCYAPGIYLLRVGTSRPVRLLRR